MVSNRWRVVTWPVLAAMLVSPLLIDCGGLPGMDKLGGLPVPAKCPDLKDPEGILKASFGLQGDMEAKVKAGIAAAANLQALAGQIEGDVVLGCSGLAKDLGATDADLKPAEEGPGKHAEAACNAAVKFLGKAKAEASAAGEMKLDITPPVCSASMDATAECAGSCDVNAKGPSAEVKCEGGEISGKCDGECKGTCEVDAGADCSGTCGGDCSGSCDAGFSGTCGGKCDGKCDGKDSKGAACKGKCEGKCDASAQGGCTGKCSGKCSASCKMTAQAKCSGTCHASCSVKMKAPQCSGKVEPPKVSAECKANCDAKVSAKASCTPAGVRISFSGDAKAGSKLAAALQKNLPILLKITLGMKARIEGAIASVKAGVEGVSAVVKGGAQAAVKVGACIAIALKAQVDASVSINVSVKASASASGSASGKSGLARTRGSREPSETRGGALRGGRLFSFCRHGEPRWGSAVSGGGARARGARGLANVRRARGRP